LIFKLSIFAINYSDVMTIRFGQVTVGVRARIKKLAVGPVV